MLERLEAFVGTWEVRAPVFGDETARATFERALGGKYLIGRTEIPVPGAPTSLCLIEVNAAEDGYTQHYFDSRGVTRIYAMTFDGREWTLSRDTADFSELPFRQRWTGTLSEDGSVIAGRWERTDGPEGDWMLDFELSYHRA